MKSRGLRPGMTFDAKGRMIAKDRAEHEQWLALHGETRGGAWIVSLSGERTQAVTVPKALLDVGGSSAGFERMDASCQRVLIPVCWCSGPGFIFDEKGLR